MAYGYGGWAPYVPVAERRRRAEKEMAKLRKKGHPVSPVTITGRAIATTFWGKSWCSNLESYRDYENRLPRGRTYVRNGSVVDLQIAPLSVTALVSGSEIYRVSITIDAVPKAQWQSICRDCAGGIDSLVELLQGRLSKAVMERLCRQDRGLFPKPKEIKVRCSCPDSAYMCKHIAAVLYGVGSRLDVQPELLFRLRSVNEKDLVPDVSKALPLSKKGPSAGKVLESDDLSALFGLELAAEDDAEPSKKKAVRVKAVTVAPVNVPEPKKAPENKSSRREVAPKEKIVKTGSGRLGVKAVVPNQKEAAPKSPKWAAAMSGTPSSRTIAKRVARPQKVPVDKDRRAIWSPSDIYNNEE